MNSIRSAAIGAIIGFGFWTVVVIVYSRSPAEVITVALIGAILAVVFGWSGPRRILTLRDLQEIIERGEFETHPIIKQLEANSGDGSASFWYCADDGTIRPKNEHHCLNPYHPYPPPRASGRDLLYLAAGSITLALIYSIVTNEALATLIVTFLLLIVSVPVFLILNLGFTVLIAKLASSPIEVEKFAYPSGILIDLAAGLWAMLIVSLVRGELPDITWFLIEFSIGVILKIPLVLLNTRVQVSLAH